MCLKMSVGKVIIASCDYQLAEVDLALYPGRVQKKQPGNLQTVYEYDVEKITAAPVQAINI